MNACSPRSSRRTKVVVAILGAVIMILAAVAAGRWWKEQAREARQLAYQSALSACARDLKPGLTRKSVEAYFHTSRIGFEKICCLGQHYQADLVKIGEEDTPWYCGPEYLDLVFEFAPTQEGGLKPSAD